MTQNSSLQPSQSLSSENFCVNCNSDNHWILHNIGNRAEIRKLCTSCVLKVHPTSFCPTCFNLHDPIYVSSPPFISSSSSSSSSNNRTLTCLKCSSVSHITCVPPNTPKSPYLCPPCSNPSFKFFDLKKKPRKTHDQNGQSSCGKKKIQEDDKKHLIDEREAKALVLAARIAVISMNKVVAAARLDVERKVKDAALARKRAKESIDHVMSLSSKMITVKQQARDGVLPGPGSGANHEPLRIERNGRAHNVSGSGPENNNIGNGHSHSHSHGHGTMVVAGQSNGGNYNNNNQSNGNHVVKERL